MTKLLTDCEKPWKVLCEDFCAVRGYDLLFVGKDDMIFSVRTYGIVHLYKNELSFWIYAEGLGVDFLGDD